MPNRCTTVSIREVGLRDGLQILPQTMPTAQKIEWLRGSYEAGLREIEVGSFVALRNAVAGGVAGDDGVGALAWIKAHENDGRIQYRYA